MCDRHMRRDDATSGGEPRTAPGGFDGHGAAQPACAKCTPTTTKTTTRARPRALQTLRASGGECERARVHEQWMHCGGIEARTALLVTSSNSGRLDWTHQQAMRLSSATACLRIAGARRRAHDAASAISPAAGRSSRVRGPRAEAARVMSSSLYYECKIFMDPDVFLIHLPMVCADIFLIRYI